MYLSWSAPAKINLGLRVLRRREDGYHELDSLFLPLDLADQVEVSLLEGEPSSVSCSCPEHPELEGGENLAARAARLLLDESGISARVEIRIHKRIWIAAGLGGGSSDGAATLRALARLLGNVPDRSLAELATRLGADVPFFLDPRPTRVRGIGELLTPLPAGVPSWPLVLLNPGLPLPTPEVYRGLGLALGARGPSAPFTEDELAALASAPASLLGNDLRAPALELLPVIAELERVLLEEGAHGVAISGSGPTVFGIFDRPAQAERAANQLRERTAFSVAVAMTARS